MRNVLVVARYELLTAVRRKSFVLTTLGVPAAFALMVGLGVLAAMFATDMRPIGYVDHSNLLEGIAPPPEVRGYPDEGAALEALEEGQVRAVYVIAADYVSSQRVELYYWESPPGGGAWSALNAYLRAGLLQDTPPKVRERVQQGPTVTLYSADRARSLREGDWAVLLLPIAAAVLLMIGSLSSSGHLLQAVATEREDRTIEVLVSTISPRALLGGKTIGLMGAILLQLAVWLGSLVLALVLLARAQPGLPAVEVPWGLLGVIGLFFLPAYGLIAALMAAVGGIVRNVSQGQTIAGMLTLPFIMPVMVIPLILSAPTAPVVVFMTLFPLTSFITTVIRVGIGVAPAGQVALSWVLLAATAIVTGWLGAQVFRLGMLRYGRGLRLSQVIGALRTDRGSGR
jgi:ABC-2 type transport system permease protein